MSNYHSKVLELVKIDKKAETSYLHVKLVSDQPFEFLLEIDNMTAHQLMKVCNFKELHTYKLSLHTFLSKDQKLMSSVTRTYRDTSEQMPFQCSPNYSIQLEMIKNS